jgi:hypothetical protein
MFLQKLCQIESSILSKQIFTFRLFQCLLSPDRKQLGFIPYIIGILQKHSLSSHLINYIFTGNFPFGGKVHSFELLATCSCLVVVPYRQMSAGFPNLKSSINLSKPSMTLKLNIQLIFSQLVELFFWTVDYNYKPLFNDFKFPSCT